MQATLFDRVPGRWEDIVQASQAAFRRLYLQESLLLRVQQGMKRVTFSDGHSVVIPVGHVAFFRDNQYLTIENIPEEGRPYRAQAIFLAPDFVSQFCEKQLITSSATTETRVHAVEPRSGMLKSIDSLKEFQKETLEPIEIISHRLEELLLWVKLAGIDLGLDYPPGIVQKIRAIISQDVGRKWRASDIAAELHVSEPTLRRRLAEHQTSFHDILTDVRLSYGLLLLQTTKKAVSQISFEAGYESPSRFAQSFRARFDLSPSEIRV